MGHRGQDRERRRTLLVRTRAGARRSRRDAVAAADRCAIALSAADDRPCHWIPFVPVQLDATRRAVALERAAMQRVVAGVVTASRRSVARCSRRILPIQRDITSTKKKWSDRVRASSARYAYALARRLDPCLGLAPPACRRRRGSQRAALRYRRADWKLTGSRRGVVTASQREARNLTQLGWCPRLDAGEA